MDNKYIGHLATNGSAVPFETADGRKWHLRQPMPDEAADGDSAYRLMYNRVLKDKRLEMLAEDHDAHLREAGIRAAAAEVAYLLPVLLQDEDGQPAYNVLDDSSLAEFEALPGDIVVEMTKVYWGPVQQAMADAKKK